MDKNIHGFVPLLIGLLSVAVTLLPACDTLEVDIVPQAGEGLTATTPALETPPPTQTGATPTPYIDHWTVTPFPAFGIELERPPDWQVVEGYGDVELGDIRFGGVNGFVQVSTMNATDLGAAVEAEAGHHLQPYGSQPLIQPIEVAGQIARLITPSDDQSADWFRQAAVIAQYPQPVEINGQTYDFMVLWADQEHIRFIAQTVEFMTGADTTPSLSWDHLPPGLFYSTLDGLWMIDADEQPVQIHNNAQAIPSADGSQLLSYDAIQQDAWLIDRTDSAVFNLTRTPDRLECCFQWWPEQPDLIVFGSVEAGATDNSLAVRFFPTIVGIDGEGHQILDTEHAVNLSGAQGTIARSPDGQTIAYGAGRYGYFYHHDGVGVETFDPVAYGLDLEWPFQIGQPTWSPDGAHLAWIVKNGVAEDGSSEWTGVVVFDLAARTARILYQYESQGVGWPPAPVWSPDGGWLAFLDSSPSDGAGLWVARMDDESQMHHLGPGGNPVWSPDGRWLAYQSAGSPALYTLAEVGVWEPVRLDIAVDAYGQLVAWVDLGSEAASGQTITGTVMDVAMSARIITLAEPVDGFSTIALTAESVLLSVDGSAIELRDIQHGMTVRVFGQPGDSGALTASQVLAGDEISISAEE